jgi:hypothetical protein
MLQRRTSFDRRRGVWNETGVSFVHRTTAVLLRCIREKGVEVTPESTRDARRLAVDIPRSGISHDEEHTRPAIRPDAVKQIHNSTTLIVVFQHLDFRVEGYEVPVTPVRFAVDPVQMVPQFVAQNLSPLAHRRPVGEVLVELP